MLTAIVAATALGLPGAWADGECSKFRDTTAAERQTVTGVLGAVKAALPSAPEGWIIGGYEEISARTSICVDHDTTPWGYTFTRIYNRADDVEQREQLAADAGAAVRASLAERQPRIDALMARNAALGAQLAEAAQAGDQARIDAINAEIAAAQEEFERLINEGPSEEQTAALGGALHQDRVMEIAVAVNPGPVAREAMQNATPPAGAHAAFRSETSRDGVTTAEGLVLLGAWRPGAGDRLEAARRDGASAADAHAMVVRVTADPARLDSLLGAVDFTQLAALLR
jgi:hypothetical protein